MTRRAHSEERMETCVDPDVTDENAYTTERVKAVDPYSSVSEPNARR